MTNEAAERLRDSIFVGDEWAKQKELLDAALAAERRATVERIREAAIHSEFPPRGRAWGALMDLLDAEAER